VDLRPLRPTDHLRDGKRHKNDKTKDEILEDDFRVKYFEDYVNAMAEAYTHDNVDVRGYMAWSLLE
jgi:beta-glucosidase